jgi:hypothetical protein
MEVELVEALAEGSISETLRLHVQACSSCGEVAELTSHLRALRQSDAIFVPPLPRVIALAEIARITAGWRSLTRVMYMCVLALVALAGAVVAAGGHPFPLATTPALVAMMLMVIGLIVWCDGADDPAGYAE